MTQRAMASQPVKTSNFYKKNISDHEIISLDKARKNASRFKNEGKRMPQRIMGPSHYWEQFSRQADALEAAAKRSAKETVCTFVYHKEDGFRQFIVAHPEVYWWYLMRRPPEMRCSYEVITEGSPCWLYFDLEFMRDFNPDSDGPRMTSTIIKIVSSYLEKYWGLSWNEENVVNLDSTTPTKFSRHLIFCKKDIAFRNNFHAGRMVKGICREIEEYLENSSVLHDILSRYERRELEELFVETGKGKTIFIDTGVYTRNRHFRIYKCTKMGKMSHLVVAPESKHVPLDHYCSDKELAIFFDSLISYFPNKHDLLLLEIHDNELVHVKSYAKYPNRKMHISNHSKTSRYPQLDKFILSLVKPGKIRICKHTEGRRIITYEIIGMRYCANIGREHKSNNIFWVADLRTNKVYQKCHDEDCADFISMMIDIPLEVAFHLDDEYDELLSNISEPENYEQSVV